jgi:hypothetical protein
MKRGEQAPGDDASRLIDQRIRELEGWRGETLARMRALVLEADAGIVGDPQVQPASTRDPPGACTDRAGAPRQRTRRAVDRPLPGMIGVGGPCGDLRNPRRGPLPGARHHGA